MPVAAVLDKLLGTRRGKVDLQGIVVVVQVGVDHFNANPPALEEQICEDFRRRGVVEAHSHKRLEVEIRKPHYTVLVDISGIKSGHWSFGCQITNPHGGVEEMSDFFNSRPGSVERRVVETLRHLISEAR